MVTIQLPFLKVTQRPTKEIVKQVTSDRRSRSSIFPALHSSYFFTGNLCGFFRRDLNCHPACRPNCNNVLQSTATCECEAGFYGNPYERCFPEDDVVDSEGALEDCQCQRLLLSTQNSVSLAKHHNSYGEYFLYGRYDDAPVYQHFAGVEYLYRKEGNWLISDEIGLREAGLQNQESYPPIVHHNDPTEQKGKTG